MNLYSRLDGDLHEWGDGLGTGAKGLSILGYSGLADFLGIPEGNLVTQPNYWTRHRIQALHKAIMGMDEKYTKLLLCLYVFKMSCREIQKEKICNKSTVKTWLNEARDILIQIRYWEI